MHARDETMRRRQLQNPDARQHDQLRHRKSLGATANEAGGTGMEGCCRRWHLRGQRREEPRGATAGERRGRSSRQLGTSTAGKAGAGQEQ
jgi:hypothetical protein